MDDKGCPRTAGLTDPGGVLSLWRVGLRIDFFLSHPQTLLARGPQLRTAAIKADLPQTGERPPACLVDDEVDVSAIWGHSLDRGQCLSPHDIHDGILSEEPLQGGTAQGHS